LSALKPEGEVHHRTLYRTLSLRGSILFILALTVGAYVGSLLPFLPPFSSVLLACIGMLCGIITAVLAFFLRLRLSRIAKDIKAEGKVSE
jgi:uncharacterized membrane protein YgaE (UPF0421/DUF939 family)